MKSLRSICLSAICLLLATVVLAAQEEPATHAPDRENESYFSGGGVQFVAGASYSAHILYASRSKLADGTVVERRSDVFQARDSHGHFVAERRAIIPASENNPAPKLISTLYVDLEDHSFTVCEEAKRLCVTRSMRKNRPQPAAETLESQGKMTLQRTELGSEMLLGEEVQHVREQRTYAVGVYGNDRPIVNTGEYWYSPKLKLDLASTRTSQSGTTQITRVRNLDLTEPEASVFEFPAGFHLVDTRGGQAGEGAR